IGNPVGDGDNNSRVVSGVSRTWLGQEALAQKVFIAGTARRDPALVFTECRRQKPCLRQHAFGAAIPRRITFQRGGDQLLESRDVLRMTAKLIVEPQHLGDEAGANLKGQIADLTRRILGGCLRNGFAIERVQPRGRICQMRVEEVIELITRDKPGRRIEWKPARKLTCRRTRRYHVRSVRLQADLTESPLKFVKIGGTNEPRP